MRRAERLAADRAMETVAGNGLQRKTVLALVGPKGAGKSTIGHFLSTELDVFFVRVEPVFLEIRARLGASHPDFERAGFEAVLETLRAALARQRVICFEATGASSHFEPLLCALAEQARVVPVRVFAPPHECARRVRQRDTGLHIAVSDDQLDRINAMARLVELPWAAQIDNSKELDKPAIRALMHTLLAG